MTVWIEITEEDARLLRGTVMVRTPTPRDEALARLLRAIRAATGNPAEAEAEALTESASPPEAPEGDGS